jgi:hypothetical protein
MPKNASVLGCKTDERHKQTREAHILGLRVSASKITFQLAER